MSMEIAYRVSDVTLTADQFVGLFRHVWPNELDHQLVQTALDRTINITAWDGETLVGCLRMLTDGYMMTSVTEILVHSSYKDTVARKLVELAEKAAPTSVMIGVQPMNPNLMTELGWQAGPTCYYKRKSLPPQ